MVSEEATALTAIALMATTFLGGPWILLWLCNRGPDEERQEPEAIIALEIEAGQALEAISQAKRRRSCRVL
jgi:hypothetical protein